MRIIKELSKIVTPKRTRHINLLSFNLKESSMLMRLYEGIRREKFSTDEEAIIDLYGSLEHKYKYSKLKYDLRKRLFNTLHLVELDVKEFGRDNKAILECQKAWTTIRYLLTFHALKSAIAVLEKHFPKMLKYEFTSMVLEGGRLLRRYYSSGSLNAKKIDVYNNLIKNYLELYITEIKIEGYYGHLMSLYVEDKSQKKEVVSIAEKYLLEINKIYPSILSSKFISTYKMIEIIKHMSQYDYEQTIKICKEAIDQLESREIKRITMIVVIYSQYIGCLVQLKRYEDAEEGCRKLLNDYLTKEKFNWFKIRELQFQIFMHSEEYQKAYEFYLENINSKAFLKLPDSFREEWRIYRPYLEFLNLIGAIKTDLPKQKKNFRLNKFLNNVPTFSKDKQGMNISIIICQLLIFIVQKNYDQVIDRVEAVEKYISRHLDNDYNYRTKYFIKILFTFADGGFEKRIIEWEKVEELKAKMSIKSLNIINPNYDVEIIRYEKLIEILRNFISK